ncbi:hypothetical protein HHI36_022718 [Cryptolaemus montrouzieri]|uniref:Uncharacterized protein n=1 Tax=Cryptolaemus montrouzieri TaxID=559131 RepID=A0ABD2N0J8_9CUCU
MCEDVGGAFVQFDEILKNAVNKLTKELPVRARNKNHKVWITEELARLIKSKNEMYRRLKKDPHNGTLEDEYKNFRNRGVNLIKTTKIIITDHVLRNKINLLKRCGTGLMKLQIERNVKLVQSKKLKANTRNLFTQRRKLLIFSTIIIMTSKIKRPKCSPSMTHIHLQTQYF